MESFSEEEGVADEVIIEVIVDNVSQLGGDMARGEGHAEVMWLRLRMRAGNEERNIVTQRN